MLLNLVKKDLLLAKNYLIFMILLAIGGPIFIEMKIGSMSGGFISFFIIVLFVEYMLFSTVSLAEDKYKGASLLCATPYTRNALVKARYLFVLLIFICCYIIYTMTAVLAPVHLEMLNISAFGVSFLFLTIYFGVVIPAQYRFGYEKIKYISFFIIFLSPFILPGIAEWWHSNNISLQITFPYPQIIQDLVPSAIALVIGFVSMLISINIYSRKDL